MRTIGYSRYLVRVQSNFGLLNRVATRRPRPLSGMWSFFIVLSHEVIHKIEYILFGKG